MDTGTTPALLLDAARMEANIAKAHARADTLGVALRPHLKTCKSVPVARKLLGVRGTAAAVSTLAEAKAFFDAGTVSNLRYAGPFASDKVATVAPWLQAGKTLEILIDDPVNAAAVGDEAGRAGVAIDLVVELDIDGYRAGVAPQSPRFAALISAIRSHPHLRLAGLYSYAGATYDLFTHDERANHVERHRTTLTATADTLRTEGIAVDTIGIGSSPALASAQTLEGLTEICAGVFVFQDLAQIGIGVASLDDIAVTVLATITQHKPDTGRVFIDAGGLALSHDRSTAKQAVDQGYGLVCDAVTGAPLAEGDVIVRAVSQEHGTITRRDGAPPPFELLPIGAKVRIAPNHICMTAAAYEAYAVTDANGAPIAHWPRANGW